MTIQLMLAACVSAMLCRQGCRLGTILSIVKDMDGVIEDAAGRVAGGASNGCVVQVVDGRFFGWPDRGAWTDTLAGDTIRDLPRCPTTVTSYDLVAVYLAAIGGTDADPAEGDAAADEDL